MKLGDALPMAALGLSLYADGGCMKPIVVDHDGYRATVEDFIAAGLVEYRVLAERYALEGIIDCPQTMGGDYPSWVAAEEERCVAAVERYPTLEMVETLWENAVAANGYCGQGSTEGFNKNIYGSQEFLGGEGPDCMRDVVADYFHAINRAAADLSTASVGYEPCWVFDIDGNAHPYRSAPDDPTKNANGGCYAE